MNQKRNRQKFTPEFKNDAVKLVVEHEYSCNEVGRRLGISESHVSRWVRDYRQENDPSVDSTAFHGELEAEVITGPMRALSTLKKPSSERID